MATWKVLVVVITGVTLMTQAIGTAQAATFAEDVGQLIPDAQVIPPGSSVLDSIAGDLFNQNDVDLFQITLTGSKTFSATTEGGASFDTQLFLFDEDGFGVYGRDDDSPSTRVSTLPANHPLTPTEAGIYYLAIASFNNDPVSSEGLIFDNDEFAPYNNVLGPISPGGEAPLSGFNNLGGSVGSYTIALTGVKSIPEPSSLLGTLAFGAFSTSWLLKRKLETQESASSRTTAKG